MHKIGFLLTDGYQLMSLGTQSVFEFANMVVGEKFYDLHCYSIEGGPLTSSFGTKIDTQLLTSQTTADTWLISGVLDPLTRKTPEGLISFLRQATSQSRRIAGICTGSFMLAEAGLLNGRRATTHWEYANDMRKLYANIHVEEDRIYIVDGTVWTSAGMTAGLDMALAIVEKDLGNDVARSVARKLVMQQKRSGGQTQHSELLKLSAKSDRIQSALEYTQKNLKRSITVDDLADYVHLSSRQFARIFRSETGQSPAKAIEGLRLESARLMIETSVHSLETIARETGFRDRKHMREVFIRTFGISPQSLRQHNSSYIDNAS